MGCRLCFDRQIPIQLLAENACVLDFRRDSEPAPRIVVTVTCVHGGEYRHVSYRGAADYAWCLERLISARNIEQTSVVENRGGEHVGVGR